jgi:NTE family protein
VATDLKKGASEYFSEGDLVHPIMASCCIPGIFSPVPINGSMYVDGGVLDNLPASAIRDKCDFLIGVNCNFIGNDFDARNLKTVIERSMLMSIGMNIKPSKTMCDVYIEPPGVSNISGFEIGKAQDLFDIGYAFTKKNFTSEDFKIKA